MPDGEPDALDQGLRWLRTWLGVRPYSQAPLAVLTEAQAALDVLAARLARAERALRELETVPSAGPFPNKSARAGFAEYVQSVARAGLAAGVEAEAAS